MNWRILFFFSLLIFVSSYFLREHSLVENKEVKKINNSNIQRRLRPKMTSSSKKIESNDPKNNPPKNNSHAKNKRYHSPSSTAPHELPINDPRHVALSDSQGNIYPKDLGVDEEYVIAYGDLIVGESRYIKDYESGDKTLKVPKPRIWPNGDIPYKVGPKITEDQRRYIESISTNLREENVVNLRPYEPSKDKAYVYFKQGSQHCYAQVGYTGGITEVALNEKCGEKEIFHEVFHVMGFFHEQNRFDRNDFVKILWENIDEKHWPQFERFPEDSFPEIFKDPNLVPFSFDTFMLYGPSVFSNSGDYSIVNAFGEPYIHNTSPTQEDFRRARLLYGKDANSR